MAARQPTQAERYERFRALHEGDGIFVMPNPWDGLSALLCKDAGFPALATSSAALAWSLGRRDGAHAVSREQHLAHAAFIGTLTGLPVNGDTEDGFGPSPVDAAATVDAAVSAGLAGAAIEDTTANPGAPLHSFDDAVARVKEAARAAKGRIVLTARTDIFSVDIDDLDEAIRRLVAFAEVGADVLYAPFLPDMDAIRAVVHAVAPKPVNVVVGPASGPVPVSELRAAGVRRISLGAAPYMLAMGALQGALQEAVAGNLAPLMRGVGAGKIGSLLDAAAENA